MINKKNPFEIEKFRARLSKELKFTELIKTYSKSYPEIKNQNTPRLWDFLNIEGKSLIEDNPMEEDRLNTVANLIKGNKINILNIGLGSANLEEIYFKRRGSFNWYGLDISPASVKRASKQHPRAKFRIGEITKIRYRDNFFDYVIVLEVLEHISPRFTFKALSEIFRVLKPGAYVIISVPLNEALEEMISRGKNPNAHIRVYTPNLIKTELKIAGFKILKEKTLFAFHKPYRIKTFIAKYLFPRKFKPNNIILLAQK